MEIEEIEERVHLWLAEEYREDALYRVSVLLSQLGDIAKFIYHDPEYNPEARVVGVHKDEISIYGEAMCHLIALMISRKVNVFDALEAGLKRLEDRDGYKKKGEVVKLDNTTMFKGIRASPGRAEGTAMVMQFVSVKEFEKSPMNLRDEKKILVTESLTLDAVDFLRAMNLIGIVTNQGGSTSHGAIIAREMGIPCVAGTERATEIINSGDYIIIDGNKGEVVLKWW
ncbi:hypothetical protein KAT95_01570 [Candidatus Parcubacteria bacterium]|nr:hypothetical protein [Candidatus Parcubacteria bacterium]